MLTRMKYDLEPDLPLSWHSASLFQGALMEKIDPQYGEILHRSELKPYSQYLDVHAGRASWILQTLTDEAEAGLIAFPSLSKGDAIHLKRLGLSAKILDVQRETLSEQELLQKTFFANCPRTVKCRFVTPAAFKTQGRYQIYPTVRHIFGSLIQKYSAAHTQTEILDDSLLDDLQQMVSVAGYRLQSVSFSVEGVSIPSFTGWLSLRISGPRQLVNLVHLLLQFGAYSGVGIKTAMGMGALRLIERKERTV